jgi:hypothetical protein
VTFVAISKGKKEKVTSGNVNLAVGAGATQWFCADGDSTIILKL